MPHKANSRRQEQPRPADDRPSACERGYDARWRKARLDHLRKHPLCVQCAADGIVEAATVVDHVERHAGDMVKFWQSRWQSLCARHHNIKTGRGE